MELGVVAAVLGAAFLYAFWNFMVRQADDKALGMASVMIGHVPLAVLVIYFQRFQHGAIKRVFSESWRVCLVDGSASFFAYSIVLWACLSAPIAFVSSLRETSVMFAVGLGTLLLGERLTIFKICLTLVILVGIIFLGIG